MSPLYDYGDAVRVIRNIRNDGDYPHVDIGELLIRRGSVGFVRNMGVFLQDQIIYSVHFIDQDGITVGCRETELIPADAPWTPNRFEFRDTVVNRVALAINEEIVVAAGSQGEIVRVLRGERDGVIYHVRFAGRTLLVPETVLEPWAHG